MSILSDQFPEYFRPVNTQQMILPNRIKKRVEGYLENATMTTLIFHSVYGGVGKTSLAIALAKDLGVNIISIGSSEANIERVRQLKTELRSPPTIDIFGSVDYDKQEELPFRNIVILDEADQITKQAQLEMKTVMEAFSDNTRFILTTNHIHNINDKIRERARLVSFQFTIAEQKETNLVGLTDFLNKFIKKEKGAAVLHDRLYSDFSDWCNDRNCNSIDEITFIEQVTSILSCKPDSGYYHDYALVI